MISSKCFLFEVLIFYLIESKKYTKIHVSNETNHEIKTESIFKTFLSTILNFPQFYEHTKLSSHYTTIL